jgi:hypothetical protein
MRMHQDGIFFGAGGAAGDGGVHRRGVGVANGWENGGYDGSRL